ncbi:MAG: rhodanese-like domain-containing protein [Myxococcota bacterium]
MSARSEGGAAWAPVVRTEDGVPEVRPRWVLDHREHRVVDVREASELRGPLGALPEVDHVPLAELGAAAAAWDRGAPLVLVCRSGGRSGRGAKELEALGFERVASLRGGMTAVRALPAE